MSDTHSPLLSCPRSLLFFFNAAATTEIYTLSLHDALPIFVIHEANLVDYAGLHLAGKGFGHENRTLQAALAPYADRKSTRLNSSHQIISYAVFCLKKKINPDPARGDLGFLRPAMARPVRAR